MKPCLPPLSVLFSALWACSGAFGASLPDSTLLEAASLTKPVAGGVAVVVGNRPDLAVAIAEQGPFTVHCLTLTPDQVGPARAAIEKHGLYGLVSAHWLSSARLPYTDNLVNLLVVADEQARAGLGLTLTEMTRVLTPLGLLCLNPDAAHRSAEQRELAAAAAAGSLEPLSEQTLRTTVWLRARKPWPTGIDEWTHYLHDADRNPVAQDRVVAPPKHYQWVSKPLWLRSHETDSSISTVVTARGRLFYIVDEAPISLAGQHPLPDKWMLAARDAFNGVLLWKIPIRRWGWREWKPSWFSTRPGDFPLNIRERLVAVGDRVYVTLGYRAPVSEIDARTGQVLQTYAGTERALEVSYRQGVLVVPVQVEGEDLIRVVTVDTATGKRLWRSKKTYRGSVVDYLKFRAMHGAVKPAHIDPAPNCATDGRTIALLDGDGVVALDFRTGAEKWRSPFPFAEGDAGAGGIAAGRRVWNGTLIVTGGVVLHASPNNLAAYDADSGKLLWTQPKRYFMHLWYEWKDVFVIDGLVWTWSPELERFALGGKGRKRQRSVSPKTLNGYDLHTGELVKEVSLTPIFRTYHHHRCYRNKATVNYILTSRRGTEFVDLHHGRHSVHNWVRGTCHVGMMPANGLQYAPPHPCACYAQEKLNGFLALAPARSSDLRETTSPRTKTDRGPAFRQVAGGTALPTDWPTFRHDAARSGTAPVELPANLRRVWRVSVGGNLSAPIAVGGRVYVADVDAHQVMALDAQTGTERWRFTAGARVDSPPTYWRGGLYFGSRDGWVYCVRAEDGVLAWKFRGAPEERFIGAFGQLESAWPIHGTVLIQNGLVYFVAGRTSELDGGLYLYALDAVTGLVRHTRRLQGPDYFVDGQGRLAPTPDTGQRYDRNFLLPMGWLPDILMSDGKTVFMRTKAFTPALEPGRGGPPFNAWDGFLDDTYFKRAPWRMAGEYGRLLVYDKRRVYYVRQFDTLRGLDPTVYFTPGKQGYLLFAKDVGGKKKTWMERIPIRIRAMALTQGHLVAAGPPDEIESADPLGAFEGREGGRLVTVDVSTGKTTQQLTTPSPPVFNGIAAVRGRLFVVERDGALACYGG